MKYLKNYKEIADAYQGSDYEGLLELSKVANKEDISIIKNLAEQTWTSTDYHSDKWKMFKKYGFIFDGGDIVGYQFNNEVFKCGYNGQY